MVEEEAPIWVLNFPAAQGRQVEKELAPAVAEKVPAGQLKQKLAPLV